MVSNLIETNYLAIRCYFLLLASRIVVFTDVLKSFLNMYITLHGLHSAHLFPWFFSVLEVVV